MSEGNEAIVPDQELVKQVLEQLGLKYVTDEDGDLAAHFDDFRIYFMFAKNHVFSVRTFYDRPHSLEGRHHLLSVVDEWNRRTLWPKVYTHTRDDGAVILIGEDQILITHPVSLDYFVETTVSWVRGAIRFDEWLVERINLENQVSPNDEQP